jgi:hypothetical protein
MCLYMVITPLWSGTVAHEPMCDDPRRFTYMRFPSFSLTFTCMGLINWHDEKTFIINLNHSSNLETSSFSPSTDFHVGREVMAVTYWCVRAIEPRSMPRIKQRLANEADSPCRVIYQRDARALPVQAPSKIQGPIWLDWSQGSIISVFLCSLFITAVCLDNLLHHSFVNLPWNNIKHAVEQRIFTNIEFSLLERWFDFSPLD